MCIRLFFQPTEEQITAAQWALVKTFKQSASHSCRSPEAAHTLYDVLSGVQEQATSPDIWARMAANALIEAIAALHATTASQVHEMACVIQERDSLRCLVADYQANPTEQQVKKVKQDRDHWLNRSAQAEQRAERLEMALVAEQKAHQDDIAKLQQRIADLNRIVAQQQEELNQYRNS
jgi:CTP synthase (UTP-ammonia lyase)